MASLVFWRVRREFESWVDFWYEGDLGVCGGVWKLWGTTGLEVWRSGKVMVE